MPKTKPTWRDQQWDDISYRIRARGRAYDRAIEAGLRPVIARNISWDTVSGYQQGYIKAKRDENPNAYLISVWRDAKLKLDLQIALALVVQEKERSTAKFKPVTVEVFDTHPLLAKPHLRETYKLNSGETLTLNIPATVTFT